MAPKNDPKNDPKNTQEQNEAGQETLKKGIPKLFILLGFIVLILLQTTVLVLILPGRATVEQAVEAPSVPSELPPIGDGRAQKPGEQLSKADEMEFKLGDQFEISTPAPGSPEKTDIYKVAFVARIKKKDEAEFTKLYEANVNLIRAEIRTLLGKATRENKQDPNQTAICNQVTVKINEILGKTYVKRVVPPEHNFDTM